MAQYGNPESLEGFSQPDPNPSSDLPTRRSLRAARESTPVTVPSASTAPAASSASTAPAASVTTRSVPVVIAPVPSESTVANRSPRQGRARGVVGPGKKASGRRRSIRGTVIVALLVPALFGTVALPAFSLPDSSADANAQLTNHDGQSLSVSADAQEAPLDRDSYSATSVNDLISARAASGYAYDSAAALAAYQAPSPDGWWRPLPGEITSPYGPRNLICNSAGCSNSFHEGMDFGNDCGTPIRAANAGTVSFVGNAGAYGNRVILEHGDGLQTVYGHIQPDSFKVKVGDVVAGGAYIANVGATGVVNGCHLDLKVMIDGVTTDPAAFLLQHGVPV